MAVATLLAAGHLMVVAAGAADGKFASGPSHLGHLIDLYGTVSGADSTFRFFAPDVGSAVRASFIMTDSSGKTWNDSLAHGSSREFNLRVSKALELAYHEDLYLDLASSCAATMLGRLPTAQQVVVRLEVQAVPTMAEYRLGARPSWEFLYEATFSRDGKHSALEKR